jgi:hypothetical protein
VRLNRTPVEGTLDASTHVFSTADDLIAAVASKVELGGCGTEAEMWERIADAYASVTGSPLDRAAPYNVSMAFAILNQPTIARLIHDELPSR